MAMGEKSPSELQEFLGCSSFLDVGNPNVFNVLGTPYAFCPIVLDI